MKTWHPDSWSKQARRLADNFLKWDDKEEAKKALFNSYRHPRIVLRACKRFGKKVRK